MINLILILSFGKCNRLKRAFAPVLWDSLVPGPSFKGPKALFPRTA